MKDRLVTPSYCFILAANFLLYFGFYILMPVLPFYLTEVFGLGKGSIGTILACYTVAALLVRPFSGYLLDAFARKPLYLLAFTVFTSVFGLYLLAGSVLLFVALRIIHGLSFGMVTVAGNTIVIDIMPSSRRGEGIGYYGLANNIAMSLGPMTGLFLHDYYSFTVIFLSALGCCLAGLVMASLVKTPVKPRIERDSPISLDRFILLKGIPVGIDLLLISIPYGITTTYVAMYAKSIGVVSGTGLFFTFMALGMAVSRMFSGRQVDHGKITQVIMAGIGIVIFCYIGLFVCEPLFAVSEALVKIILYGSALALGVGSGMMFPAFNTMFVNLGRNDQRGTATSTYLTSWDVGIGIGLVTGGVIGGAYSFSYAYLIGAVLCIVSLIVFKFRIIPHFQKNRLR
ncbi:MFS transporter [Muribaculum sp. An289]|uniref:MFS transporter n=1 Tax=unclassified Muribaculum TaxID=2622126 RepID=UPI000B366902|nr:MULTISPECIES: MFS transporter [unclassified Muribaculum]OUO37510.1 MFS transporter [Muribaculum sp. An289]OUO43429.1 MFS transporter [Muribaculum sp. An287]